MEREMNKKARSEIPLRESVSPTGEGEGDSLHAKKDGNRKKKGGGRGKTDEHDEKWSPHERWERSAFEKKGK